MAIQGYKKPLESKDLWVLNKEDSSQVVVPKFEKEWKKETAKNRRYNVLYNRIVILGPKFY